MGVAAQPTPIVAGDDAVSAPSNVETLLEVFDNDVPDLGTQVNVIAINGMPLVDGVVELPSGATLRPNPFVGLFFDPRGAYPNLAAGDTLIETFTYEVEGLNGTRDIAQVTLTIEGVRGLLPVTNADLMIVENAGPVLTADQIVLTDGTEIDSFTIETFGGSPFLVGNGVAGDFGALTLQADGTYRYSLTPGLIDAAGLTSGETVVDRFAFTGADSLGNVLDQEFTVTITGADDPATPIFGRPTGALRAQTTPAGAGEGIIAADGILYVAGLDGTLVSLLEEQTQRL